MATARTARIVRETSETRIAVAVNLDGSGAYKVATGIGFLDHMIEQFSRHSLIDIDCEIDLSSYREYRAQHPREDA